MQIEHNFNILTDEELTSINGGDDTNVFYKAFHYVGDFIAYGITSVAKKRKHGVALKF